MSNYSWECRRNPLVRATMRYWGNKHVVYRCYGGGEPLYIGASSDIYERMKAHRRTALWWPEVDRVVLKVYPSREAAWGAEAEAIRAERPRHNSQYLKPRAKRAS